MLTKTQRSLALGYARRQAAIAQMAIEMHDMQRQFGIVPNPDGITLEDAVKLVMTAGLLEKATRSMRELAAQSADTPTESDDEPEFHLHDGLRCYVRHSRGQEPTGV